jgi:hypothetical protein
MGVQMAYWVEFHPFFMCFEPLARIERLINRQLL